ncbi:MAG: DUF1822 family protein [Leptolyngbyaceae cyanobacterium RU_5_1]|nr:DUF1822 family protein [Leptolyngbyaceae cyanobacterium RU_5_1]
MINQPPAHSTDLIDWGFPLLDRIELSPDQIDRAVQLSQTVPNAIRQWQTYLNALALFGFQEWLDERAPDLEVVDTHCSLLQPAYANLIDAVCNLHVGPFILCLITAGTWMDAIATLPKAVIDLPPFVPHIYTLVRVLEEQMQVQIYGYLRHDQLVEHQQSSPLQATSNWTYTLPLNWFNLNSTELLLDLRCLQPAAILRPTTASPERTPIPQIQARFTNLLPQLRSATHSLSQLLTWEDGATILTDPELANWVYQIPVETRLIASLPNPHPAINVSLWLRDRSTPWPRNSPGC